MKPRKTWILHCAHTHDAWNAGERESKSTKAIYSRRERSIQQRAKLRTRRQSKERHKLKPTRTSRTKSRVVVGRTLDYYIPVGRKAGSNAEFLSDSKTHSNLVFYVFTKVCGLILVHTFSALISTFKSESVSRAL